MSPRACRFWEWALISWFCWGLGGAALAAEKPATALLRVERERAEKKEKAAALDVQKAAAEAALKKLQAQAAAAASALADKEDEQAALEAHRDDMEKRLKLSSAAAQSAQKSMRLLSVALVRLARMPGALFLFDGGARDDHVHRSLILRALVPLLRDRVASLSGTLIELDQLRREAAAQQRLVEAARQNLAWQRTRLDELVKARQGLLQKTAAEKETIAKDLAQLADEAKDLRQLLDEVNRRAPAAPRESHAEATALRRGLRKPVSGKILRHFGEKDPYGLENQGVTYTAAAGAPVLAPQKGRVVFLGPFKGYGLIVILQHAGGYHSLLAGFGRIDAEMGQTVEAGEPLGILPSRADDKDRAATLYFEWRHRGEAEDPAGK